MVILINNKRGKEKMKKICLTFLLIVSLYFIACSEAPDKGDMCIDFYQSAQLNDYPITKYVIKGKRSDETFEYTIAEKDLCVQYLEPGKWSVTVNAYDANNNIVANCSGAVKVYKSTCVSINMMLVPYQIVARFEAEYNFDNYNYGIGYSTEGLYAKVNPLGWIEYKINFTVAGNYKIEYRVNCPDNAITFDLKEGDKLLGSINTPKTDATTPWKTVEQNVNFETGIHILRIIGKDTSFNLNWLNISIIPLTPPSE